MKCATQRQARYNKTTQPMEINMEKTFYDKITGERVVINCEEDLINAQFEEMCDVIDGTIGLIAIALVFTLIVVLV